jgi:hypothetical protein
MPTRKEVKTSHTSVSPAVLLHMGDVAGIGPNRSGTNNAFKREAINAKRSGGLDGIRPCPLAGAPADFPSESGKPYQNGAAGTVHDLQLGVLGANAVLVRFRVFLLAVLW